MFGLTAAVAWAVAAFMDVSAFADSRHQDETWRERDRGRGTDSRRWRDDERVTLEGTIRSLDRDRDGYRVELDRGGYHFRVPQRSVRSRARDFRVGAFVRFGGVFRNGAIFVDVVEWPSRGSYDRGYDRYDRYGRYDRDFVRGVVERVDYRRDVVVIREASRGRFVTVDLSRAGRWRRSVDADDLRRGDVVELSGAWVGGGHFEAYRVESVRRW